MGPAGLSARANGTTVVTRIVGGVTGSITIHVMDVPPLGVGGGYGGHWTITNPLTQDSLQMSLAELGSVNTDGNRVMSGSVTYRYSGTWYAVPMVNPVMTEGGAYPRLTFTMGTPEFNNPQSYAAVAVNYWGNGVFDGGAILYLQNSLVRESRGWHVTRAAP